MSVAEAFVAFIVQWSSWVKRRKPGHTSGREKAGSIFWSLIAVLFGWTLFVFWWRLVLTRERPAVLLFDLLIAIGFFVVVVVLATFGWIEHNQEIARVGKRGGSSPYRAPFFTHDALDRPLSLPEVPRSLQDDAVVHVGLADGCKVYSPERVREAREAREAVG